MSQTPPVVLTIAGFDPSSGAGVTADIKTIAAHGCYGVAAITALTVQSTGGVRRVAPVDPGLLIDTLKELTADISISATHIGMLGSGDVALRLAGFLERARLPNVVLDPILKSSSGASLLDKSAWRVLKERILPLASIVTPNVSEAAALTEISITGEGDMQAAACRLHQLGARAVVITGGDLPEAVDFLSISGQYAQFFRSPHLASTHTHGTGCAFATAIACHLAHGSDLSAAVLLAKSYVAAAIAGAYPVGQGPGPVNHMEKVRSSARASGGTEGQASGKG